MFVRSVMRLAHGYGPITPLERLKVAAGKYGYRSRSSTTTGLSGIQWKKAMAWKKVMRCEVQQDGLTKRIHIAKEKELRSRVKK